MVHGYHQLSNASVFVNATLMAKRITDLMCRNIDFYPMQNNSILRPIVFMVLMTIIHAGCKENTILSFSDTLTYLPDADHLYSGIVGKYYVQYITEGSDHPKMDIRYRKMQVTDDLLCIQEFDAAFTLRYEQSIKLSDDRWLIHEVVNHNFAKSDTLEIQDSVYINWIVEKDSFSFLKISDNSVLSLSQYQEGFTKYQDSIGRSVSFSGTRDMTVSFENNENAYSYQWERKYTEGLGMTDYKLYNDQVTTHWELVKLISLEEFMERANHGMHRVGYIDTAATLDAESGFTLCNHFSQINDYYNGDDAGFIGGKGRIKKLLERKLNKALLTSESGYLTYRFVINCRGEAGWFVTEEADLQYQPKRFNEKLRKHLFSILKDVRVWKPLKVRGDARDAYTYLTFKIKDGKIIEILP